MRRGLWTTGMLLLSSVTVQGVEDQDGNTNSWGLDAHEVCVTAP